MCYSPEHGATRTPDRSRPPAVAPRRRVTLHEAAEISDLSYPEVHRRATTGQIPGAVQADDGTWSIRRSDTAQLERRELANDKRHAVMLRPDVERYEAWEREAKHRGLAVSALPMQPMDEASGCGGEAGPISFTATLFG